MLSCCTAIDIFNTGLDNSLVEFIIEVKCVLLRYILLLYKGVTMHDTMSATNGHQIFYMYGIFEILVNWFLEFIEENSKNS